MNIGKTRNTKSSPPKYVLICPSFYRHILIVFFLQLEELGATRTYTEQQCESQLRILLSGGTEEESGIPRFSTPDPPPQRAKRTSFKRKRTRTVAEEE
jgi:hypothetical protein